MNDLGKEILLLKPSSQVKEGQWRGKLSLYWLLSRPAASCKWDGTGSNCGKHGGEFRGHSIPAPRHGVAFRSNLLD